MLPRNYHRSSGLRSTLRCAAGPLLAALILAAVVSVATPLGASAAGEVEPVIPCVGDACAPIPSPPEDPQPGTLVPGPGNPPPHYEKPKKPRPHRSHHHHKHRHAHRSGDRR